MVSNENLKFENEHNTENLNEIVGIDLDNIIEADNRPPVVQVTKTYKVPNLETLKNELMN